jgi:hypothetical protein
VSNRERDAIRPQLKRIAAHLLKLQYQPERATPSWSDSIIDGAEVIEDAFDDSPSLRRVAELPAFIAKGYPRARRQACKVS